MINVGEANHKPLGEICSVIPLLETETAPPSGLTEPKGGAHSAFKDMRMAMASKPEPKQNNSLCLKNMFELHKEKGHDQLCACSNQGILNDDPL